MLNSPLWPAWLAVGFAVLLTLNQMLSESEKFANLLGRFGRWFYDRARTRRRMDTVEFNSAVREAVKAERKSWEEDEERALKAMEGRLEYVTDVTTAQQEQLKELNFQIRCHTSYSEYEAEWHNRLRILILRAAKDGGAVAIEDFPPHIHYAEFEDLCRQNNNMRWRTWGII